MDLKDAICLNLTLGSSSTSPYCKKKLENDLPVEQGREWFRRDKLAVLTLTLTLTGARCRVQGIWDGSEREREG